MWRKAIVICLPLLFGTMELVPAGEVPEVAQRLLNELQEDELEIQLQADLRKLQRRKQAHRALRDLQEDATKAGRLDDAIAIRSSLEQLEAGIAVSSNTAVLPAPERLYEYRDRLHETFYFHVVGKLGGTIWGTQIYTGDSPLAVAAVHAGLLEPGQAGVLQVTMLPGQLQYAGSTAHGVTSHSYSQYPFSYKVTRAKMFDKQSHSKHPSYPILNR